MRKVWKINYLQYSGYDCSGHYITSLFFGTYMEAARECIKIHEGVKSERQVVEFIMPDLSKKRKAFYIV